MYADNVEVTIMVNDPTGSLLAEADARYSEKDFAQALDLYEQVIVADPANAWACSRIGTIYALKDELETAEEMFLRSIELDATLAHPHSNLGNIYFARSDYEGALAKYLTAVKLNPDVSVFHENLHAAYKKLGKITEAVTAIKTANRLKRIEDKTEAKASLTALKRRRGMGCLGSILFTILAIGLLTFVL
jgi:tetratricopeptide (TPR) repeat protein